MIGKVIKCKVVDYNLVVIDKILINGNNRYLCAKVKLDTQDGEWQLVRGTNDIILVYPEWITGYNTDKVKGL